MSRTARSPYCQPGTLQRTADTGGMYMRSAIILVGGEARRANGKEKYFFRYQGRTFIERLIDSLRDVVDEIGTCRPRPRAMYEVPAS